MKTVFVCRKCGCGFLGNITAGTVHGPAWQWPLANQFGPLCGGLIESKIIVSEANNVEGKSPLL